MERESWGRLRQYERAFQLKLYELKCERSAAGEEALALRSEIDRQEGELEHLKSLRERLLACTPEVRVSTADRLSCLVRFSAERMTSVHFLEREQAKCANLRRDVVERFRSHARRMGLLHRRQEALRRGVDDLRRVKESISEEIEDGRQEESRCASRC